MHHYPVTAFLEKLANDNPLLTIQLSEYVLKSPKNTLGDLLVDLSEHDHKEILAQIIQFLITKQEYVSLIPKVCLTQINNQDNFSVLEESILTADLPFSQRHTLYWFALSISFTNQEIKFYRQREAYLSLLESAKSLIDINALKNIDVKVTEKRVFIFINQYISVHHAPSFIASQWSDVFIELGYQVVIISCSPSEFAYPSITNYSYNKLLSFGQSKEIKQNLFLIEIGANLTVDNIFLKLIDAVQMNDNDKFLLIGHSCIPFDVLPFRHKCVVPTYISLVKHFYTSAKCYILDHNLNLENIYQEQMSWIKGPSDYKSSCHSKIIQPSGNQTINVAIVGNRLLYELDSKFWKDIELLFKNQSNIKLHLIGQYQKEFIPEKLLGHLVLAGYQSDLATYLQSMHFYLNPDRKGGGSSAIMAIKAGIPVITLADNDVYYNIQKKYKIDSMKEIGQFIQNYMNNTDFKIRIDNLNQELIDHYSQSQKMLYSAARSFLGV